VILGVGIDVVDIDRFGASLERTPSLAPAAVHRRASGGCHLRSLAARFAAKEAFAKALGSPVGLCWSDATVLRADDGRLGLG
jgi:holo-[acyl-carrier protein] synthase